MQRRWIVALALIATAPAAASAQFTTFIAPPNPVKDSIKAAVVSVQRAVADSVTAAKITDMKVWVDSAAGLVAPPLTDSALGTAPAPRVTPISNGIVAPQTASPLPLLLAVGGCLMLVGGGLMRRPRAQSARVDR